MGKKILVVDDEPLIQQMVMSRLNASGYQTISANDGLEGLQKAKAENPDLIILDVMMPKMDGYQVCATLKQDQRYQGIPIILFTAKAGDDAEKTGVDDCGANAFMTKPFEAPVLLAKISELLKGESQ